MLNKLLKIGLPIFLIGVILLISYNTYKKTLDNIENPIIVIPNNASIILQFNNNLPLINDKVNGPQFLK